MPARVFGHTARLARVAVEDPARVDSQADPKLLAWRSDGVDPDPGLLLVELTTALMKVSSAMRAS